MESDAESESEPKTMGYYARHAMAGFSKKQWKHLGPAKRQQERQKHDYVARRMRSVRTNTQQKNKRRTDASLPLLAPSDIDEEKLYGMLRDVRYFVVNDACRFFMTRDAATYSSFTLFRIDKNRGYTMDNVEPRPWCLCAPRAFTKEQLAHSRNTILDTVDKSQWDQDLVHAFDFFGSNVDPSLDVPTFRAFLKDLFIMQRGRCAYTGFPLELKDVDSPYRVGVERRNPNIPYNPTNVVLICRGVQHGLGKRIGWSQAYWDMSMAMSHDLWELIRKV